MTWALFDRVAEDYDQVAPFFASYGASIVDVLDPPPGCRFLDLGAGRGALTGPALARGYAVTAVDGARSSGRECSNCPPTSASCAGLRASGPDASPLDHST